MSQYNFELNLCSEPKFSVFWNLEVFETCMFVTKQKVWSNGDSNLCRCIEQTIYFNSEVRNSSKESRFWLVQNPEVCKMYKLQGTENMVSLLKPNV